MNNHLRDDYGAEPVCREPGLSVLARNARRKRPKSARRQRDEHLVADIRHIHTDSGETYGARGVHRRRRREGVSATRCTVERLMREDGLEGVMRAGAGSDAPATSR